MRWPQPRDRELGGARGLLLFVTVNDHLTLALKSFTGQVERDGDREWKREGGSRREAHSLQEGQRRGEKEQPEHRMDGRMKGGKKVCLCVRACLCAGEFLKEREGESEGCVPQG